MQEVLYYHSGMAGMPAGNPNTSGGVIAILDACLVNGANSISVTGLVQSAGTATATTSGTHNFNIDDWIEIAGATPTAYSSRFKVTAKTANTFDFAVASGTASPATGAMTAKHPAAGWTKSFSGTNTAGYRSATAGGGMGHHIQIEDNNPNSDSNVSVRARMAVNLTGLNTAAELTEQCKILKTQSSNYYWLLIADSKTCYLIFSGQQTLWFGEAASSLPTDSYCWFMNRGATATAASNASEQIGTHFPCSNYGLSGAYAFSATHWGANILRGYSQIAGSASANPSIFSLHNNVGSLLTAQLVSANPTFGASQFNFAPIHLSEFVGVGSYGVVSLRCKLRGVAQPLGLLSNSVFNAQDFIIVPADSSDFGYPLLISRVGVATNRAQIAFVLSPTWS